MTRKWIAINVALLGIAGLLGWQLWRSIQQFKQSNDVAQLQPAEDPKKLMAGEGELPPLPERVPYDPAEYQSIPGQNLFAEGRGPEAAQETPAVVEAPSMSVKPILAGVTLWGNERVASIVDPTQQGGARRKVQSKRLGDTYQGFTITDITADRIILEAGGQREVIPLYDGSKRPAQAGKTPIVATRIVNFGAGAAGGGAVARPTVVASSSEPPRPAPQAGTVMAPVQGAGGAARQPAAVVPVATQPAAEAARPGELRDAQGRRIIRTPFGDIVRPDPPMN